MFSTFTRTDSELAVAAAAMMVLTWVAYRIGLRWQIQSQWKENGVLLVSIGLAFWLAWSYFGRLVWAERITTSSVLCWSNITPVALGLTGGLVGHARGMRRAMRPFVTCCLMLLAVVYVATPMARPVFFPLSLGAETQWRNGVCMQSHSASCAPAAAVTLLKQHGFDASEDVLSKACLSSTLGTAPLGLYRGLKTVAMQHGHRASVADRDPNRWIEKGQLPCVALITFEKIPGEPSGNRFLGSRFSGHAITVLGRTDGDRWLIGDPAVGKVSWSDEQFRQRFTGEAIYLKSDR